MSDQLKAGSVRNDDTTDSIGKGAALHQAGELEEAAKIYKHHMGRYRDAIPLLKKAHAIDASSYQVCNLLGACLMQIGDEHDAVGIFEAATRLHADNAEPWANLEIALQAVGQNKRARECVDLILSYANALLASGLNETALEQLHTALAIDESNLTVRWLIAMGRLKTVYDTESEVLASRQAFSNRDLLKRYGGLCVEFMAFLPRHSSAAGGGPESLGNPPIGRKLRLGVVSAHIREHSIWTAISKGWLRNLDRDKFEIYVFHLSSIVDGETEATMASVDHFDNQIRDVADWVETISSSKLDVILYPEIGTDSLTLKLASLRLAPIQSCSLDSCAARH